MSDQALRRIAAEMLRRAVEDMRNQARVNEAVNNRINATVWLVSTWATPWFDVVGFDQRASLEHAGWEKEARRLLDGPARVREYDTAAKGDARNRRFKPRIRHMSAIERRVLREGLSAMVRERVT